MPSEPCYRLAIPIMFRRIALSWLISLGVIVASVGAPESSDSAQLRELAEQNRRLQELVKEQQRQIESLAARLGEVQKTGERHEKQLQDLREGSAGAASEPVGPAFRRDQELRLSGEAGFAFFNTGAAGQFPKAEFRVDEARLAVESPVMKDVYLFGELNLLTREANDENFYLGEFYVDFENVSGRLGGPDRLLNLRAGRVGIPFGEEYLLRGPMTNPLISHSLPDVWGVDEGVEIYGGLGRFQYALAVQNGGTSRLHDFNADKAVAARLGWDPGRWLHLSASAMRTGELGTATDSLSEVWFADGFFRALGPARSTGTFWADLYEGDATARWKSGHLSAALGRVRFDDSDTTADNARRMSYGYLEAMQGFGRGLYGAARYSAIHVPRGYPLAGWGNMGRYFFAPSFAEELQRLSLGLGYRFGPPLVLKLEYARESGRQTTGASRDQEDFFGTELGVKF